MISKRSRLIHATLRDIRNVTPYQHPQEIAQMTTLQGRSRRPNGHSHEVALTPAEAQCPTCDQPISAAKYAEIEGRRRAHDAQIERAVETRFAREIARMQTARKGEIAKAVREAV